MVTMDAVKEIMKRKGVRPSDLCEGLGIKSNVLSERFKQKNVSVNKLNEMVRLIFSKERLSNTRPITVVAELPLTRSILQTEWFVRTASV